MLPLEGCPTRIGMVYLGSTSRLAEDRSRVLYAGGSIPLSAVWYNLIREEGKSMRQTSTEFMDELLKDNATPQDVPDLSKQIADVIDKKMEQAMKKFEEQVSKVVSPSNETEADEPQNNNMNEEDFKDEEQGEEDSSNS